MKTLQDFILEQRGDIISDNAVYYKIAMHKYKRPQVKPYWDKDYNINNLSGPDKRKALIKAIEETLSNNKDYIKFDWFIYCYKPLVDELGLEKVQRYTDKLGMTQFNDSRIK